MTTENGDPGSAGQLGTAAAAAAAAARPARSPVLRVLPGVPESAAAARALALQLLGRAHPAADTVMLLVSELVTNAVMHTRSGAPGGSVTLALCPGASGVLVQVRDDGGASVPSVTPVPADRGAAAEHGYGLLLVDALADSWGTLASPEGRVTWCRVSGATAAPPDSETRT